MIPHFQERSLELFHEISFFEPEDIFYSYDSVMLDEMEILSNKHGYRLLEVDNRLDIAANQTTLILVSSRDVLHS